MTWFTWHFNVNLIALAWVLTTDKFRDQVMVGASVLAISNLLAVGGSAAIFFYDVSVRRRASELMGLNQEGLSPLFGGALIRYGIAATFIANFLVMAVWIYIIIFRPFLISAANSA
jgi:hypothetical protein